MVPYHCRAPIALQFLRIFIDFLSILIGQQSFKYKGNRKNGEQIQAKPYQCKRYAQRGYFKKK